MCKSNVTVTTGTEVISSLYTIISVYIGKNPLVKWLNRAIAFEKIITQNNNVIANERSLASEAIS